LRNAFQTLTGCAVHSRFKQDALNHARIHEGAIVKFNPVSLPRRSWRDGAGARHFVSRPQT